MKITVSYDEIAATQIDPKIEKAVQIGDFVIELFFHDGHRQIIDFKPFLEQSNHPEIRKYLEKTLFSTFTIANGNLNWNEFDLIFPLESLYQGQLD